MVKMMTTMKIFERLILFCLFSIIQVLSNECTSPLGMADSRIEDSQITTSSVLKDRTRAPNGGQARLNQRIKPWGGWCPDISRGSETGKNYDQYIQIDLLHLTNITGVATQGREHINGREYVKHYKISYKRDGGKWDFYREKNQTVKIFKGNTDVSTVVRHKLDPAVMARYIRVHPGYYPSNYVCMRLELYGCLPVNKKGILFYSMPVGQTDDKVTFKDISYNGIIANGVYKDGTGILTDGMFGPDDAKQDEGKGWVGWSSNFTNSSYIDITFEFSGVTKLKDVTLTVNVNKKRSYAVFSRSEIFFASNNNGFSDTSFLQFCPRIFSDNNDPYITNITLSLCENTARFIKLRLYFGGRWLLITEISFNSVPSSGNEITSHEDCSGDKDILNGLSTTTIQIDCPCTRPVNVTTVATSSTSSFTTTATSSTSSADETTSPTLILVIVAVTAAIVLIVSVYKKQKQMPNLPNASETVETHSTTVAGPSQNNQSQDGEISISETSERHSYVIPIQSRTAPYKVVQIVNPSSSVNVEIDGNQDERNETPILFRLDSGLVNPTGIESIHEEIACPPLGYTQLDGDQRNETDDNHYQKLEIDNSGYVIPYRPPSDEEVENKIRSLPGYTKLDETKREQDDNASYQKLMKRQMAFG